MPNNPRLPLESLETEFSAEALAQGYNQWSIRLRQLENEDKQLPEPTDLVRSED